MRINTNVSSMTAQENASNVNKNLSSSLEKLSSGLRINKASDDASGMAIADKLRTQASSIGQGISNANSGNALIQIADKAMAEQSNILDIVKTKLIQAGTSTTSTEGREAIRKDITKLLDQLDNISSQTNYNGINLLNQKGNSFNFQVGEAASFDIGVTTAYAVNTSGLGASEEIPVDADATLRYATGAGSVAIKENETTLTVKNNTTAASIVKAIAIGNTLTDPTVAASDSSFKVTANDVQFITLTGSAAAGGVTLSTSNEDTINTLNAMAASQSANLTKVADGTYSLTLSAAGTSAVLNFSGKIDLTDLTVSGLSQGTTGGINEAIIIGTSEDVNVTKLSGAKSLSLDSATVASVTAAGAITVTGTLEGKGSTNPSGLVYSTSADAGVLIDTGTASVKVDQSTTMVDNASIAINSIVDTSSTKDTSFAINATNVQKITMTMSAAAATGSVVLTTTDTDTMNKLSELSQYNVNLTNLGNGTFQFSATAAGANAVLDFGSEKVNIKNLNFSGVQNGTAEDVTEKIFIQTDDAVTVTKNGISDDQDVSIQAASGTTVGAKMVGVHTDSASASGSLAGLKGLSEDGLTADVANSFMTTVDAALNQINAVRSDFGSTQNQLDSAIRNMMTTQTNIKAAESVIRDVDYASESANFNKQNIIAQAGTYAMSQANAIQQNILRLLQ